MNVIGKILFIIGLGLTIYAGFESMLLCYGTSEPQVLRLSELGRKGRLRNTHVAVSDFTAADGLVIESNDDRWTRVWVPLFTPDGKWTERPVVAYVTGVRNETELATKIGHEKLTGVVTNGMQSLGRKQQEHFAPQYPGVDLSNAIALHIGRRFPSPAVSLPLLVLGIVLLLGGIVLTFFPSLIRLPG